MLCRNCGTSAYDHIRTLGESRCSDGSGNYTTEWNMKEQWYHGRNEDGPATYVPSDKREYVDFLKAGQYDPPEKPWASNPKFAAALKKMATVHDLKSADYAQKNNRYSNFEEAAATAGVSVDEVFAVLIGIKLARLRELLNTGKIPNNESVEDTKLDLANYATLWFSYNL